MVARVQRQTTWNNGYKSMKRWHQLWLVIITIIPVVSDWYNHPYMGQF
jgi:hypothetical protein